MDQYRHGTEIIEVGDGFRPIRTVRSSVIGVIGTAPDADGTKFPINTPVALTGDYVKAADLGADGTLRDALDDIFDQAGATVVVVRVNEGANDSENLTNIVGDFALKTGVHAFLKANDLLSLTPKMLIAPGFTDIEPTEQVSSVAITNGGSGIPDGAYPIQFSGGDGSGAKATGYVINGAVEAIIVNNGGWDYTEAPTAAMAVPSGTAPTLGTVSLAQLANPVAAEMIGIADRMRAMILADGPNTTDAAAIAYRNRFGSRRMMVIDPWLSAWNRRTDSYVGRPSSARAAGVQARMDLTRGYWWPFSNQPINGVGGASRSISWNIEDPNTDATYLNENEVTTIINKDGFRFWGLRTCSTDPQWAFWNVCRVADQVYQSIVEAFLWAMDRPFSRHLIVEIVEAVQDYLSHLKSIGAILGGTAWIDPHLNTRGQLAQGKLRIEFDFEPPAPLEHLIFGARRETAYYDVLIQDVLRDLQLAA